MGTLGTDLIVRVTLKDNAYMDKTNLETMIAMNTLLLQHGVGSLEDFLGGIQGTGGAILCKMYVRVKRFYKG